MALRAEVRHNTSVLYLATSCLQGRAIVSATLDLLRLHPDGLQLCPGNHPADGFGALLRRVTIPLRYHHGFSWRAYRAPVWSHAGDLLVDPQHRSVHPPRQTPTIGFEKWLERVAAQQIAVEIMPPGWILSDERSIDAALDARVPLAVDVSHLHILREQGRLTDTGMRRILNADTIVEVHVSDNDGRFDLHRPIGPCSFGTGWARERARDGLPVVLECYMHRLDEDERRAQVERWR
ncbi:MAG: hypothetical protein AAFV53_10925 [Myxococcota bacterium]